jgi:hypothetical protein
MCRARELELRSSELRQYDVLHSLLSHARHVIFQDQVPAILVFRSLFFLCFGKGQLS